MRVTGRGSPLSITSSREVRRYSQSRLQNQFFLKLAVRRRIGDARADIAHRRRLEVELFRRRNVGQVEILELAEVTRHARIDAALDVGRFLDRGRFQHADNKVRDPLILESEALCACARDVEFAIAAVRACTGNPQDRGVARFGIVSQNDGTIGKERACSVVRKVCGASFLRHVRRSQSSTQPLQTNFRFLCKLASDTHPINKSGNWQGTSDCRVPYGTELGHQIRKT